ncbi:hypothetical protein FQN54_002989 [Arachnomyces sp. PD_36]|nr:hypothetical protein FQN54_002989 [Arachnomyces sp. PD_36]
MPASNGARENGERGKKNRGKEKARLYELSNTSSASLSEGDLHGFSRDLKRLAKICRVLMPGEQLDAAEMALQPQLDREAEIETLKNSLEVMREERQRDKDVRDGKEQELENMRKEIDKKTKQLQCEKAAGESKREEYQKKMADKQEKSWNKEKESLTQQKKQEVSALQTRLKKLEDSNNILEKEKTILRQDLRDTTEKLKSEAMARRGIEILVDQLNQRQENLMSDVGVTSKPAED